MKIFACLINILDAAIFRCAKIPGSANMSRHSDRKGMLSVALSENSAAFGLSARKAVVNFHNDCLFQKLVINLRLNLVHQFPTDVEISVRRFLTLIHGRGGRAFVSRLWIFHLETYPAPTPLCFPACIADVMPQRQPILA